MDIQRYTRNASDDTRFTLADGNDNSTPIGTATLREMEYDYVIISGRLAGQTWGGTARPLVREVKRVLQSMQTIGEETTITLTSRFGLPEVTLQLIWLDDSTYRLSLRARCECGNPVSLCHPEA